MLLVHYKSEESEQSITGSLLHATPVTATNSENENMIGFWSQYLAGHNPNRSAKLPDLQQQCLKLFQILQVSSVHLAPPPIGSKADAMSSCITLYQWSTPPVFMSS
jgi:hypothetical protein